MRPWCALWRLLGVDGYAAFSLRGVCQCLEVPADLSPGRLGSLTCTRRGDGLVLIELRDGRGPPGSAPKALKLRSEAFMELDADKKGTIQLHELKTETWRCGAVVSCSSGP